MRNIVIKLFVIAFMLYFFSPALIVQAADTGIGDEFSPVCIYAGSAKQACEDCAQQNGAWTAFGCIVATPEGIFRIVYRVLAGVAGGIAFLLILFGGFQIMVSAGNPEQLNAGRELVTSAIAGLLLIVFSVFLLKLIGYDILRIPGFLP